MKESKLEEKTKYSGKAWGPVAGTYFTVTEPLISKDPNKIFNISLPRIIANATYQGISIVGAIKLIEYLI